MNCENCGIEHLGQYASGRFCSSHCSHSFSTALNRKEINQKISKALNTRPALLHCKVCQDIFAPSHKKEICCSKECKRENKRLANSLRTQKQKELAGAKGSKGKYKRNPESLLDLSPRTISKILSRLGIGCSRCGWNEASCDIHHIYGRNIENANHHANLTCLCPNCHRLFHSKKIGSSDVICLIEQIGDKWKECYYG